MSPSQTWDSSLDSIPAQHRDSCCPLSSWIRYGVNNNRKSPRGEGGRETFGSKCLGTGHHSNSGWGRWGNWAVQVYPIVSISPIIIWENNWRTINFTVFTFFSKRFVEWSKEKKIVLKIYYLFVYVLSLLLYLLSLCVYTMYVVFMFTLYFFVYNIYMWPFLRNLTSVTKLIFWDISMCV